MAISDKTIHELQEAVKPFIISDKNGHEYSSRPVHALFHKFPEPEPLVLSTLTGLVDYCLKSKDQDPSHGDSVIHVLNHGLVRVLSSIFGPANQRVTFAASSFEPLLGKSFCFGQYYDHESFIVGMQSLFEPTPERAQILKIIGSIKENQIRETSDDGVTQEVAAKAGIALVTGVPVPNPVILRPYRTFREVDQPESPFILRVRAGKEKPEIALFEADGGRWKLTAIQEIREYLEDKVEIPIYA